MKKWCEPKIIALDVSQTAYNSFQGDVEDGIYIDWETCEEYPTYS